LRSVASVASVSPPLLRRVSAVVLGTSVGQLVLVASTPVVARLYTPVEIGGLATFVAIIATLAGGATLKFPLAIPLPAHDRDARALAVLSLWLCVGAGSAVAAVWMVNGARFAEWLQAPEFARLGWQVGLGVTVLGALETSHYLAVRAEDFNGIGVSRSVEGVSKASGQVGFGSVGLGVGGLILADVASRILAAIYLFQRLKSHGAGYLRSTLADVLANARRYRSFAAFGALAGVLNVASRQSPVILLAATYGAGAAGTFALAQRFVAMPATLLSQAISQVALGELTRRLRAGKQIRVSAYWRGIAVLTSVAVPVFLFIGLAGPSVISVLLGPAWDGTGSVVRALSVSFALQFAVVPMGQTLVALERQGLQLMWDAMRLILAVVSIAVGYNAGWSLTQTVLGLSVVSAFGYVVLAFLGHLAVRAARPSVG